ncbi:MAG: hypothetical protein ACXWUC_11260, partial [Methylosarcina sp.]
RPTIMSISIARPSLSPSFSKERLLELKSRGRLSRAPRAEQPLSPDGHIRPLLFDRETSHV